MMKTKYKHIHKQEVASTVWTVNHNLNTLAPITDCFIDFEGAFQKAIPLSVRVIDKMTCVVDWTSPRSGKCSVA